MKQVAVVSVLFFASFVSVLPGFSQSPEPLMVQGVGFAGGSAILNGSGVSFSYGGGLRLTKPFENKPFAYTLGAEYNKRGKRWQLHCLDVLGTVQIGRAFFLESGLFGSIILSSQEVDGWDDISTFDFGYVAGIGYHFKDVPGLTFGFIVRGGLVDLTPDIEYTGRVNQISLVWGPWVGIRLF